MSMHHNPRIVTDGLEFFLDEGNPKSWTGSALIDLCGNHIVDISEASYDSNGIIYNGTTSKVKIPYSVSLAPQNLSIEVWLNLENQSDRHVIFTKWLGYTLEVNAARNVRFGLNGLTDQYFGTQYINWDTWYQIVCTYDDITKEQSIYINGEFKESQTPTGSISIDTADFWISGSWDYAKGSIPINKFYTKCLSSIEVSQNFNTLRGRFNI